MWTYTVLEIKADIWQPTMSNEIDPTPKEM